MTKPDLLQLAQSLNSRNEAYAIVTVVRVAAPTSAYVGAQAIVTAEGTVEGWIGGGCARDVVTSAAREAIASGEPKLVRIANDAGPADDGVEQHAMACASNGTIELFIQPYSTRSGLCVIGATPAAAEARFLAGRLGIRLAASPGEAPVVLIATQGQGDADALETALTSSAERILMIASRRKADQLRDLMRLRGISAAQLDRLEAPAGPDAGARTPAEIALVAMTGVLAALRDRVSAQTGAVTAAQTVMGTPSAAGTIAAEAPGLFVNPVCGVAVSIADPLHVETFAGERYYFCCNACWTTFKQNPAKYAAIRNAALKRETA